MFSGKRLKELRLEKGLTQEELGKMINVTKVSICCYEKGTRTPNVDTLADLTEVLNISSDYLLGKEVDVVCESDDPYYVKMSSDDIDIINEIKKHRNLYNKILADPGRTVTLMSKKVK